MCKDLTFIYKELSLIRERLVNLEALKIISSEERIAKQIAFFIQNEIKRNR